MTVDNKLELMQIALEVYKIEAKHRGNHRVSFFSTYASLEDKINVFGETKPATQREDMVNSSSIKSSKGILDNLPTASEYFKTKKD